MRQAKKYVAIGGVALVLLLGVVAFGGWVPWRAPEPEKMPIDIVLKQSEMLQQMAQRMGALGFTAQEIAKEVVWQGQKSNSLSWVYRDLWPVQPPVFQGQAPLVWQMGRAGERRVFFLDDLPESACQKINEKLKFSGGIPESTWSKQGLLWNKVTFPPDRVPALLKQRGCLKTAFATYLYYHIL